jgi:Secretion system C-terminal sorting domain
MKKTLLFYALFWCLTFCFSTSTFSQTSSIKNPKFDNPAPELTIVHILTPNDSIGIFPQNVNWWTGTCTATDKVDSSRIITILDKMGWMVFDVSSIPGNAQISSITFTGYVDSTNYPYWSATPLMDNPITSDAPTIWADDSAAAFDQNVAYIYSNENATFDTGWHSYPLMNNAVTDLQNALSQGWFAMGIVDRDWYASYFINFDGWNQPNPPYLEVQYVLPVELTSFNASVNQGNVTLNWSTATENNNKGFQVQRKTANGQYQNVTFVDGHGTTTELQNYAYVDKNIANGNYSYRLKQIDFNGTFDYSKEINVAVNSPATFSLKQNYPNPFNPTTKIDFSLAIDSKVTLRIYDVLGRQIAELLNSGMSTGVHTINFNAANLTSGVYFYKLEAKGVNGKNFTSVKKMILTK